MQTIRDYFRIAVRKAARVDSAVMRPATARQWLPSRANSLASECR